MIVRALKLSSIVYDPIILLSSLNEEMQNINSLRCSLQSFGLLFRQCLALVNW